MTDKTLVERLEIIENYLLDVSNGNDAEYEFAEAIHHTIAALSPVLPEEVQEMIYNCRANYHDGAADLIKRLQRELNHQTDNASELFDECKRLQARIEELETWKTEAEGKLVEHGVFVARAQEWKARFDALIKMNSRK